MTPVYSVLVLFYQKGKAENLIQSRHKIKLQIMKKIITLIALAAVAVQIVQAQKSTFGFTAGATLSKLIAKFEGASISSQSKIGFTAGITGDIQMGKNFSFMPALNFVQKGAKSKQDSYESTTNLNYIEIPLNFVYRTPGQSGHLFIGAGPSFAYGISGKMKDNDPTEPMDAKVKFGTTIEDDFKPLEIGANILLGYLFKNGFNIAANYNMGLNNISPQEGVKVHNNYFGLRLGIILAGKK